MRLFDVGVEPAVNGKSGLALCGLSTSAYGQVAEQLAIVELLKRGNKVAVPVVDDDGVDLVVDYRWRVQVKNAQRRRVRPNPPYEYDVFGWSAKAGRWRMADVFLLHGLTAEGVHRWWVVPAAVIPEDKTSVLLYEGSTRGLSAQLTDYEDAWDVFDG